MSTGTRNPSFPAACVPLTGQCGRGLRKADHLSARVCVCACVCRNINSNRAQVRTRAFYNICNNREFNVLSWACRAPGTLIHSSCPYGSVCLCVRARVSVCPKCTRKRWGTLGTHLLLEDTTGDGWEISKTAQDDLEVRKVKVALSSRQERKWRYLCPRQARCIMRTAALCCCQRCTDCLASALLQHAYVERNARDSQMNMRRATCGASPTSCMRTSAHATEVNTTTSAQ